MRWFNWIRRLFGRWRPVPDPDPPGPGPDPPQGDMAADAMEAANRERDKFNRPPLEYHKCLASQAQSHAESMMRGYAKQRTWSQRARRLFARPLPDEALNHDGFSQRLAACGFGTGSENVAQGRRSGDAVISGWMGSSGHRKNLLKAAHTLAGVGYSNDDGRHWWCMIYARED